MNQIKQGYKQTKVGIIPEDWDIYKMDEVFYEVNEKVGNQEIDTYSISAGIGYVSQKEKFGKDISGSQNENYVVLDNNQFAYNKGNSKTYQYGCVYPNNTNKKIAVPNVFISFDFRNKAMSVDYYAKLFENHFLDRELRKIISSSARMDGLLNINKKYFFEIPIVCPPLKEQEKIAKILTTWDEAITKQTELLRAKELQKKGLMQKLLSGEVRFSGFSDEWEEVRLGEIGQIVTGTTPPTDTKAYYENGQFPWITPTDINDKKDISKSERYLTSLGLEKGRFIPKGSLLVTCIASIGKNAILTVDGSCNQQINAILPSEKNNINYLYYFIEYKKDYLIKFAGQSATQILNKKSFSSLKIKLPSLPEQRKIAEVLSLADDEINLLKNELEELKLQKKALMQKLLTGEVRVKV